MRGFEILSVVRIHQTALCFMLGLSVLAAQPALAQKEDPSAEKATDAKAADKPAIDATHPLYPALERAYKSRAALADVKDYEAVFNKKEVIDRGKPRETTMKLKLRQEPFSVYLYFVTPNTGREVIYAQGKYKNQLMVHETGVRAIAGTIPLDPKGRDAMADNKYPVTMLGMRTMLDRIITQWELEGKFSETTVQYFPDAKLGEIPCMVIESSHPEPRNEFKFKQTRLWIEKEGLLPVRVEQYGFPGKRDKEPPLVEEYTYSQIKTNAGLTDMDFDHTNKSYAFP